MAPKIIVNSPWYFFALSFLFGLAGSFWLYYKNIKSNGVPKSVVYLLLFLRFVTITAVTFFLLSLFLKQIKNETENPIVILALDNSSSINMGGDSAALKNLYTNKIKTLKKEIGSNFSLKTILFGSKSKVSEDFPDFSENETDMEGLIKDVENNYSNQNVGALIVASDGIYNKGTNPVYSVEKLGFPIYCIALGDTLELKDGLIQKVNHNQIAYLGNNFPVEVIVNAKKFAGKEMMVSLLVDGKEKARQSLKVNSDNFYSACQFTLNAETSGLLRCTAKIAVMEGEKNLSNNSQSFIVEVIANKEKIVLLANSPHPDVAAIREAVVNNTSFELDYFLTGNFKSTVKQYNLVIFHGYNREQALLLNECKNNNIPFWIINPGIYENIPGLKATSVPGSVNDSEPYADETFGLFIISDGFKNFISTMPAVKTRFGKYNLSNGAVSLFNQKIGSVRTRLPLFFFGDINGLKNACFLGDGLWKWKMRDYAEHKNTDLFNELVNKSIQYLSVKSDKSFFRVEYPKIIEENKVFEMNAEVYNKSYELITEPEVSVVLSNKEGKKFNYTFSKTTNSYKLNTGFLPFGEYSFESKVKVGEDLLVKKGSFIVKEVIAEKINTVANHQLLFQLSNRTNGKVFHLSNADRIKDELLKNKQIKPITYSQSSTTPLIDLKWLFWMILTVFGAEWLIRKRFFVI